MADFPIEQALYRRAHNEAPHLLGRSSGFRDEWLPWAQQLLLDFGDRPPGVRCPSAVFAQPFAGGFIAIVQVGDLDVLQNGFSDTLGYRLLILPRQEYTQFLGDPFVVAAQHAPDWQAQSVLPTLHWPAQPLPPRTVAQVRRVLQRTKTAALVEDQPIEAVQRSASVEDSVSPVLLGGTQVLVDGGRLVLERPTPDTELLRDLWVLLPTSTRSHLWPASFAFSNTLHFDAVIVSRYREEDYPGCTTEEQAADYPEGRYELSLQTAAEQGDQQELDALFGRQSLRQTVKLGLFLLGLMVLLLIVSRIFERPPEPPPQQAREHPRVRQARIVAGTVALGDPWLTATTFLAARDTLNALTEEAREREQEGR